MREGSQVRGFLDGKPAVTRQNEQSLGASREQKISSVSIYLTLVVFKSQHLKYHSFSCFGIECFYFHFTVKA